MILLERIIELLSPNAHMPTVQHVSGLWERHATPNEWDWDQLLGIAAAASVYIADVRNFNNRYLFIQVGGGRAVTEFFTEEGLYSRRCPDCGGVEIILHRKSPWIITIPELDEGHTVDCPHSPIGLDRDQLTLCITWLILGLVYQLMQDEEEEFNGSASTES